MDHKNSTLRRAKKVGPRGFVATFLYNKSVNDRVSGERSKGNYPSGHG